MARKRNEEYQGDDDDDEFIDEPVESYEDPPDFVDDAPDEGEIFFGHEITKFMSTWNVILRFKNAALVVVQIRRWLCERVLQMRTHFHRTKSSTLTHKILILLTSKKSQPFTNPTNSF